MASELRFSMASELRFSMASELKSYVASQTNQASAPPQTHQTLTQTLQLALDPSTLQLALDPMPLQVLLDPAASHVRPRPKKLATERFDELAVAQIPASTSRAPLGLARLGTWAIFSLLLNL